MRRLLGRLGRRPPEPEPDPIDDPPFLVDPHEDPVYGRRILNDVYGRTAKGSVWHRIHARQDVGLPIPEDEGRGLVFACGLFTRERPLYVGRRPGESRREPLALRVDPPPQSELCRPCREEDANRERLGTR